jgi:hypothetical protein
MKPTHRFRPYKPIVYLASLYRPYCVRSNRDDLMGYSKPTGHSTNTQNIRAPDDVCFDTKPTNQLFSVNKRIHQVYVGSPLFAITEYSVVKAFGFLFCSDIIKSQTNTNFCCFGINHHVIHS